MFASAIIFSIYFSFGYKTWSGTFGRDGKLAKNPTDKKWTQKDFQY